MSRFINALYQTLGLFLFFVVLPFMMVYAMLVSG